jgi:Skp family chaperone for outer membrane proteins
MQKWIIGLVATCLVLSIGWAQGTKEPVDGKVLVLDLQRAVEECDEHRDMVAALRKRAAEKKKEMEGQITTLQADNEELMKTSLTQRDEAWYERLKKALVEQVNLKVDETYHNVSVSDELARKMNALVRGAQQEARRIMRARGAELVLISKLTPVSLETEEQWKDELINRRVLCSVKEIDITDEVKAAMDEWYKNRAK